MRPLLFIVNDLEIFKTHHQWVLYRGGKERGKSGQTTGAEGGLGHPIALWLADEATRRREDSYVSCSALSSVHKGLIEGPMSSACQIALNMPIVKKIKIFNNQAVSQEISTVPAQTFTFSLIRQLLRNERFLSTVCTSPQMSGSGSKKNA